MRSTAMHCTSAILLEFTSMSLCPGIDACSMRVDLQLTYPFAEAGHACKGQISETNDVTLPLAELCLSSSHCSGRKGRKKGKLDVIVREPRMLCNVTSCWAHTTYKMSLHSQEIFFASWLLNNMHGVALDHPFPENKFKPAMGSNHCAFRETESLALWFNNPFLTCQSE